MNSISTNQRDIQRLQRAIVDGLEDVKGQDICVFNTEHLSPLFERVVIASGTSNRQTRALASAVKDSVREAGFPKPRIEGEANGEWIIVDCGAAVAHVMQPAIRQYYHLEDIWGEKPVRLKFGAPKPRQDPPASAASVKSAAKPTGKPGPAAKADSGKGGASRPARATPSAGSKGTGPSRSSKAMPRPATREVAGGRQTRQSTVRAPAKPSAASRPPSKRKIVARKS